MGTQVDDLGGPGWLIMSKVLNCPTYMTGKQADVLIPSTVQHIGKSHKASQSTTGLPATDQPGPHA